MQNIKSEAALGEELGGNEVKRKTTIFRKLDFLQGKLALRGSLAVTWLTVYRQLQVIPMQLGLPAGALQTFSSITDAWSQFFRRCLQDRDELNYSFGY